MVAQYNQRILKTIIYHSNNIHNDLFSIVNLFCLLEQKENHKNIYKSMQIKFKNKKRGKKNSKRKQHRTFPGSRPAQY